MNEDIQPTLLKKVAKAVTKRSAQSAGDIGQPWRDPAPPVTLLRDVRVQDSKGNDVTLQKGTRLEVSNLGGSTYYRVHGFAIDPDLIPQDAIRLGQKTFPWKYRGHTIRLHTDAGGGHKAIVSKGNEVHHVTKRHPDPMLATHHAKTWINEQQPAKSLLMSNASDEAKARDIEQSDREYRQDLMERRRQKGQAEPDPEEAERDKEDKETRRGRVVAKPNGYNTGWRLWTSNNQQIGPDFGSQEEATYWAKRHNLRLGQATLQNPEDTTVTKAPNDLDDLRQQAIALQAKMLEVQKKAQAYVDALANKTAASAKLPNATSGMLGLQQEVSRMNSELTERLKALPQNFIQFADGVTIAKVQTARLNDPAWSKMIETARTRGKGIMQRVVTILDRLSILFSKLTANIQFQEFQPGELTEEAKTKIQNKNVSNTSKINKFQNDVSETAANPRTQRYFTDTAGLGNGGTIQTPGFKGAQLKQFRINDRGDFAHALQLVRRMLRGSPYLDWIGELDAITQAYGGDEFDPVDAEDDLNAVLRRYGVSKKVAQEETYQMEFDFMQELIEGLSDSLNDIVSINSQLETNFGQLQQQSGVQENYPLPDANPAMPIAAQKRLPTLVEVQDFLERSLNEFNSLYYRDPKTWDAYDLSNWNALQRKHNVDKFTTPSTKFTKATNPAGRMKVQRSANKKLSFAKHELEDYKGDKS